MKMKKRTQSSIEFTMVISMVVLGFFLFLVFYNVRMADVQKENNHAMLVDISQVLKSEIEIGAIAESGYERTFFLPEKVSYINYEIVYRNGTTLGSDYSVFVARFTDPDMSVGDYVFFLSPNVSGTLNMGADNIIRKTNGTVCINEC